MHVARDAAVKMEEGDKAAKIYLLNEKAKFCHSFQGETCVGEEPQTAGKGHKSARILTSVLIF